MLKFAYQCKIASGCEIGPVESTISIFRITKFDEVKQLMKLNKKKWIVGKHIAFVGHDVRTACSQFKTN